MPDKQPWEFVQVHAPGREEANTSAAFNGEPVVAEGLSHGQRDMPFTIWNLNAFYEGENEIWRPAGVGKLGYYGWTSN